ncbi:MAG: ExeM/NucH family extracellular endonuclease, partial [Cellulomonadaceae bacterium]|nr:ExeM/NucH family extracellular endonuclease [Cellulomonadaceae bacterium]
FTERNPRTASPADVGGDLQVGAFNVLNYFTTLSSVDADARGAATADQLAAQRAKIVAAITSLDEEVIALQEIENSTHFGDGTPDVALADLVAGLNAAEGSSVWAYVPTPAALVGAGAPATDVITSAIIYRTDAVTPQGASTTQVDETVWGNAREPIAQAFTPLGGGAPFIVVANHFKSKSGTGTQPADGQGFFNADRVAQANAVASFVGQLTADTGIADVVALGDFNAYAQEDPIAAFAAAGFVDVAAVKDPTEYTYTFDGEQGSLDHALATPSFASRVTGADVWDINADEWAGYEYVGAAAAAEAGTVYRASDHDPILLGLTAAATPVTIDLLGINDFHGRLEAGGAGSPLVAGAAVLAGAVDSFRAANPDSLFISAGDSIGASTFTSFIQKDSPTIAALNAMGLDVSALGNHEFDQGRADLDARVIPQAAFPYLGANVYDRATGEPAYDESYVTDVDGISVGFIGAVTAELPSLVTPAGIASLEVKPVVPEVNRVAAELSDGDPANGEADVIVLLVHEGPATGALADSTNDSVFGQIVAGVGPQVDAIFSGHTHQKLAHQIPVEGWDAGLTRPVVQSGQYGENIAHVTLTVDPTTGDVVSNSSTIVPLTIGVAPGTGLYPADPEVAAIVADAVAVANVQGAVSLGSITADLNRARQPDGTENRGGESTLSNLVADVQLAATAELGTQIAFMNPGGLRTNLTYASSTPATPTTDPDGNVTYREAATVQPFANTLVTETLTGVQVVAALEQQWQPAGAARPFLKLGVSGLTYTYDPTAAAGARITQVMVGDAPLDLAASYKVVVNSFLASGGDNFAALGQGTGKADSGRVDLQAFVDYFAANSPVSPDLKQRAVGVHVADVPATGYAAGDTVTVNLSSLLFSGGEAQGTEVTLAVGGTQVATAAIDPVPVITTDEVGRATATFTVPQGLTGETFTVDVAVPSTGTTASFVLPLAAVVVPTCTVDYSAVRLGRGFLAVVTVHNDTDAAIRGWSLTWQYTKGERAVTGIGAKVRQTGTGVTATSTV